MKKQSRVILELSYFRISLCITLQTCSTAMRQWSRGRKRLINENQRQGEEPQCPWFPDPRHSWLKFTRVKSRTIKYFIFCVLSSDLSGYVCSKMLCALSCSGASHSSFLIIGMVTEHMRHGGFELPLGRVNV